MIDIGKRRIKHDNKSWAFIRFWKIIIIIRWVTKEFTIKIFIIKKKKRDQTTPRKEKTTSDTKPKRATYSNEILKSIIQRVLI